MLTRWRGRASPAIVSTGELCVCSAVANVANRCNKRQGAFDERRKILDLLMEGVELALKKRGYPALVDMKTKWKRKER
jgi:hypothetical protein